MLFEGNIYKFSTDRINIFSINADSSSSMESHADDMREGLRRYKKSFENFSEANSMAVAINMFASSYYPSDFKNIKEFSTDYRTGGSTAIYYSIEKGAENLLDYIKEITARNNCIPRATFIVLSDGEPCNDPGTESRARKAIEKLNAAGVTTVFVAFGNAISSNFGKSLGFIATLDIRDKSTLTTFMGEELSRSCKEQSKSMKSLGAEFFSQANRNSRSAGYSAKSQTALEDDDWFDDI